MIKIDMTPQEMFDTAVGGLIKQGRLAVNHEGKCSYRTEQGDKCAFGQCIPDDRYSPNMEGIWLAAVAKSLRSLDTLYPQFVNNFTPEVIRFGVQLQRIHDTAEDFDVMLENYKSFGRDNNLSLEVFDAR